MVYRYVKTRLAEGASGRCINMELGELSRAIGRPWRALWPKVRKLEERKDIGRAISTDEERRLLDASVRARSPLIRPFLRIALLTGMRSGEITSLTWGQVNMEKRILSVGRAKTPSGTGRQIPMNRDLYQVLSAHHDWFMKRFGELKPEQYLFPFGSPMPADPNRPITDISGVWDNVRKEAGVRCRIHDLRHTIATKMAEAGVPENTMLALMGHLSHAMLERYSHIRMAAKREAVEALSITGSTSVQGPHSEQPPTISPTLPTSPAVQ